MKTCEVLVRTCFIKYCFRDAGADSRLILHWEITRVSEAIKYREKRESGIYATHRGVRPVARP
jgi:hypothetical protein